MRNESPRSPGFAVGLVALLLSAAAAAQDKPLTGAARKTMVEAIQRSMAKTREIAATFEQEKHYALFDDVARQSGVILYQRPDRLRWEIREPFRSILIVSGTDVAKFEFQKGERRKLDLGRAKDVLRIVMDQIRSWFQGDFEQSATDYTVEFYAGDPKRKLAARIVLRPKSKALRKSVQAFELDLAGDLGSVSQVTIREAGGDRTVMRFHPLPPGQKIDLEHFDVKDPRDFKPTRKKPETRKNR